LKERTNDAGVHSRLSLCTCQWAGKGGAMNLKRVNIELDVSEIQEILAIDMDEDAQRALDFLKEHLAKSVKKALQPH
jgi:hypothetical protein